MIRVPLRALASELVAVARGLLSPPTDSNTVRGGTYEQAQCNVREGGDQGSEWVHAVASDLSVDEHRGLRALRACLHSIRDHLPEQEVTDLAAQLPMMIRGLYFEGWSAGRAVTRGRDLDGFLAMVHHRLEHDPALDPAEAMRAVIGLLGQHVSAGELRDIIGVLPAPIAALWTESLL